MNYITKFNKPDVHIVVSAWPEKTKRGEVNHGVAWYTKLTLEAIAKKKHQRFVVLAEKGMDNNPKLAGNGKILVLRVFDNNHTSLYPKILTWLNKFPAVRDVSVHSEFGVNAGLQHYLLLIPFLLLIKLTGKKITYFAHNVIEDITPLMNHIGLPLNPYLIDSINLLVRIHAKLLTTLTNRIVVLEQSLADRLIRLSGKSSTEKIHIVPIPVDTVHTIQSKETARKQLHLPLHKKILLVFGFLSSYKGSDWMAEAFTAASRTKLGRDCVVVFAGGPAHSLKERPHYQQFIRQFEKMSKTNPAIIVTGFVPESAVSHYFQAADLVILPYRGLMGASGGMAQALTYKKPFLASWAMKDVWKNQSFRLRALENRLRQNDMLFQLSYTGILQILKTVHMPEKLHRLIAFSHSLGKDRAIENITNDLYNQLYDPSHQQSKARIQPRRYPKLAFGSSV